MRDRIIASAALAAFIGLIPAAASAQPAPNPETTRLLSALSKVESNLGEASMNLYAHALLPASHPERPNIAKDLAEDLADVERYLGELDRGSPPEAVRQVVTKFRAGWTQVGTLSQPIVAASAERPASPDALLAHYRAVDALDQAVDDALEAMLQMR